LIVAEGGEGRIVRLEPETGARTPLALLPQTTTTLEGDASFAQPRQMILTPYGDLLVLVQDQNQDIFIVRQAMATPPLESLRESRLAHNHTWAAMEADALEPQLFWTGREHQQDNVASTISLGSMALTPAWTSVYVSLTETTTSTTAPDSSSSSALLYQLSLVTEEDDDDEDDNDDELRDASKPSLSKPQTPMQLLFNLTQHIPFLNDATTGPLVVTNQGLLYWVVNNVYLVVLQHSPPAKEDNADPNNEVALWGYIQMPDTITSLSVGGVEDGALYLTTRFHIYKCGTAHPPTHPFAVPMNLAPKQQQHRRKPKEEKSKLS